MLLRSVYSFAVQQQINKSRREDSGSKYPKFNLQENKLTLSFQTSQEVV